MENFIPGYELATKVATKNSDHDVPSDIILKKRHALHQNDIFRNDVDFVVSLKLTTQAAGYQSLYK